MAVIHQPNGNHLLRALTSDEQQRLLPYLEPVDLPLGTLLHESGEVRSSVYFPVDCIVAQLSVLANGSSAETAVVGNDGLIGIAFFMGEARRTGRAIVRSTGCAYRLPGQRIQDEFHRNGPLHDLLLRYTQARITQMAQTAVCNRDHSIDQRLCRWLLLTLDRLPSNHLIATQQLIADMLGVRREGITQATRKLRQLGIIHSRRGRITVMDRPKLLALCCECYSVVRKETDRLMP